MIYDDNNCSRKLKLRKRENIEFYIKVHCHFRCWIPGYYDEVPGIRDRVEPRVYEDKTQHGFST